jgi:hypothetical protein
MDFNAQFVCQHVMTEHKHLRHVRHIVRKFKNRRELVDRPAHPQAKLPVIQVSASLRRDIAGPRPSPIGVFAFSVRLQTHRV